MTPPTAPIHTATCPYCKQVMAPDASCLPVLVDEEGGAFERIRYGSEGDGPREPRDTCPDCGVLTGKVHHLHCDQERCPKCSGQMLSCLHMDGHHGGGAHAGGAWVDALGRDA